MLGINKIKKAFFKLKHLDQEAYKVRDYYKKYRKFSFSDGKCSDARQFEASITRLYHTIEKGLSYIDYRPGFGKDRIENLLNSMEQYAQKYDVDVFFYQTALSVLNAYIEKNEMYGLEDDVIKARIHTLPGIPNDKGGIISFTPLTRSELDKANFKVLTESRHSIRHFSSESVDLEKVKDALILAQHTPSACNRQGWRTYIIADKKTMESVLENQNGNQGFGHEFDKLILICGDLRFFNKDREIHQVFIDGGMYAMRVLDSLFYEGIATVPLSASLTHKQEVMVRKLLNIDDAEVPIMFIGLGNYPDNCQTTKSERKPAEIIIV